MRLTSRDIVKLITYGLVIFFILLVVDLALYSFIISLFTGDISASTSGIHMTGKVHTINLNDLSLDSWATWLLMLLMILTGFVIWVLIMRQIQQIQIGIMSDQLEAMQANDFNEPIKFRFSQASTRDLVEQINKLSESKQRVVDSERDNEVLQRELIGNVSHDLRTPLTSIIGYLGLLQGGKKLSGEKIEEYSSTALSQAEFMKTMINDLFDYTQTLSSDSKAYKLQPMNVSDFFNQLVAQFEPQAQEAGITMDVYTNPKTIEIEADPEQMARVFMNLINNAFKYAKTETFIKLSATINKKKQVELFVQNDGDMIPKSAQKKLFDRFYRVDKSRNKEISGTGLGLAIAKGIVLKHKGHISVSSDKRLTSFIITLPQYSKEEV